MSDTHSLEAKIDSLTAAVAALVAGLSSGAVATTQPGQAPDSPAPSADRMKPQFSALNHVDDYAAELAAQLYKLRSEWADAYNLGPLDRKTLVTHGGRGLYRAAPQLIAQQPVEFRRFVIEDASDEDLVEAQKMGRDLLMDRGGDMPAPPTWDDVAAQYDT